MTDAAAPAAGWYADPRAAELWRWWDGTRWTAHTLPRAVEPEPDPEPDPVPLREPALVSAGPQAAAASDWTPPRFDWGALDEPVEPDAPSTVEPALPLGHYIENGVQYNAAGFPVKTDAPAATAPASASFGASAPAAAWTPTPTATPAASTSTVAAWGLVTAPLWNTVLPVAAVIVGSTVSIIAAALAYLAVSAAGVVAGWVLAYRDQRELRERGLPAPHPLWILLSPPVAYLIARHVALSGTARARPHGLLVIPSAVLGMVAAVALIVACGPTALLERLDPPPPVGAFGDHERLAVGDATPDGEYLGELTGGRALLEQQTADLIASSLGLEPGFARLECTTPLSVGGTTPGCHFEAAVPEGDSVRTTTVDVAVTIDFDLGVFALATP